MWSALNLCSFLHPVQVKTSDSNKKAAEKNPQTLPGDFIVSVTSLKCGRVQFKIFIL